MRFAKILALMVFSLVIYQLIGIYNTTAYETSFVREFASTSVINSSSVPFLILATNGYCNDSLISYVSGVGSNYYLNDEYWIPTNILLGISSRTFTNNNCSYNGKFDKLLTNNVSFESRFYGAFSASYIDIFLRDNITCFADSIKMTNNGFYNGNINLNYPYTYYISLFKNESVLCFTPKTFYQIPTGISHYGSYYWEDVFVYPFNSGLGNVDINVTNDGTNPKTWYYYPANSISSPTLIGTGAFSAHYTLTANTDYVLYGYKHFSNSFCAGAPCTLSIPNVIINIDTCSSDVTCGEYDDCINGTKQRLCHDLNGFIPDYLEFELCYSAPDKILWLGMENTTTENVFYTEQGFVCIPTIYVKNVDYPTDWYSNPVTNPKINNNYTGVIVNGFTYDNMMMSRETAKEGVYSLKLWNIPPERYIPYCPNNNTASWLNISGFYGLCVNGSTTELYPDGNYTISLTPQVQKLINETYLVAHDLTFGYPNMTISLSIKKCDGVIKQYLNNSACQIIMGEGYYTIDKTSNHQIYNTKVFISIYDLNLSSTVYTVYFDANNEKLWNTYNIILSHLDITHLYRFSIGIYDDIVSGKNYCAYIDDINLNAYSGSVGCESYCDDVRTYHQFISQNQFGCSFLETPMSPKCFDSSLTQYLTGCSPNFCPICEIGQPDYLTLYSGDNSTGACIWSFTENSDYCISYCSTQKLISDNPLMQDIAVYFQFLNPIWIITFVIMGIGAYLSYKIKDWHIFAIAVIIGFFISAIVWIEMAFIAICIMIVVAYFMLKDMSSK